MAARSSLDKIFKRGRRFFDAGACRASFAGFGREVREWFGAFEARTVNGRRPPLQGGGCGFESRRAYHLRVRAAFERVPHTNAWREGLFAEP
jgi:hypothetical protein